ncbi:hypothetical protein DICPUDRAFT_151444 [Dictyostelium purpureum]|uniref:ARID domain-containing protein n=1 Tax=Dictyostelium purpureum TaxID=5786 RepID=F0ZIV3_DICPU|nr:uncharacterized protein DICPUDRAFT_151444 [Dictyostelium purpureum]EGC36140.1 hypothetical protein DICPUDRAFT_151444 [Dictyostelium purpureum]|eukprot:XP_003287333.1 hypothetical protein DICPUDRAFT_151444 [Dictyostelium purpureum]
MFLNNVLVGEVEKLSISSSSILSPSPGYDSIIAETGLKHDELVVYSTDQRMSDDLKANDHQKQQVQREQQEKEITVDIESNSNSETNINRNTAIHKSKDKPHHHHHNHHHHHPPKQTSTSTTNNKNENKENVIEHKTIKEDNSDKENKKSSSSSNDKKETNTNNKDNKDNNSNANKTNNEQNSTPNTTTTLTQKEELEMEEKLFRNQLSEFYSVNGFFKFYNLVSAQGGYLRMKQENWNELCLVFEVKSSELKKRYLDYLVDFEKVFLKNSSLEEYLGSIKESSNFGSSSIVNSNSNSYNEKNDEPKLGDVLAVTTRLKRKDILQGQTPPPSTEPTRVHGIFYDKDLDYNKTLCIFSKKAFIETLKKRAYRDHFNEDQTSDDSASSDSRVVKKLKTTATRKINDTSSSSASTSPVLEETSLLQPHKKKSSTTTSPLITTPTPTTPPPVSKDLTPRMKKEIETPIPHAAQSPPTPQKEQHKDKEYKERKDHHKETTITVKKEIEMKDIKEIASKTKTHSINKRKNIKGKIKN